MRIARYECAHSNKKIRKFAFQPEADPPLAEIQH
jgi:hypothetical protein